MSAAQRIVLKPIGFVRTRARGKEVRDRRNVSEIVLREDISEALDGIEGFFALICDILDA